MSSISSVWPSNLFMVCIRANVQGARWVLESINIKVMYRDDFTTIDMDTSMLSEDDTSY